MLGLIESLSHPELKNREGCDKIGDGSVAEWLKAHDSKSCGPPKGLGGSNPLASATTPVSRFFSDSFFESNPLAL